MKRHLPLAIMLLLALTICGSVQAQQSDETEARKVAESFMELINSGKYSQGWMQISEQLKPLEDKRNFIRFYRSAHKHLGRFVSRKLINVEYQKSSSPDDPILKGIIFTYKSVFQRNNDVGETIGVFLERDGQWHVGFYLITPSYLE